LGNIVSYTPNFTFVVKESTTYTAVFSALPTNTPVPPTDTPVPPPPTNTPVPPPPDPNPGGDNPDPQDPGQNQGNNG